MSSMLTKNFLPYSKVSSLATDIYISELSRKIRTPFPFYSIVHKLYKRFFPFV